jgi:predicted nucleotidyltransferase
LVGNEGTTQSDVNILVSFEGATTFDKYIDPKIRLEDQVYCSVDLVVAEALHKRVQPNVQQEVIYVSS